MFGGYFSGAIRRRGGYFGFWVWIGAMYIDEFKGGELDCGKGEEQLPDSVAFRIGFVAEDARRVLVGAGARALFYPTLLYNVLRNKVQAEFRWWDRVDEVNFILYLSFLLVFEASIASAIFFLFLLV